MNAGFHPEDTWLHFWETAKYDIELTGLKVKVFVPEVGHSQNTVRLSTLIPSIYRSKDSRSKKERRISVNSS